MFWRKKKCNDECKIKEINTISLKGNDLLLITLSVQFIDNDPDFDAAQMISDLEKQYPHLKHKVMVVSESELRFSKISAGKLADKLLEVQSVDS